MFLQYFSRICLGFRVITDFFFLSLYAFPPKGALGYEAAPFPHL